MIIFSELFRLIPFRFLFYFILKLIILPDPFPSESLLQVRLKILLLLIQTNFADLVLVSKTIHDPHVFVFISPLLKLYSFILFL